MYKIAVAKKTFCRHTVLHTVTVKKNKSDNVKIKEEKQGQDQIDHKKLQAAMTGQAID